MEKENTVIKTTIMLLITEKVNISPQSINCYVDFPYIFVNLPCEIQLKKSIFKVSMTRKRTLLPQKNCSERYETQTQSKKVNLWYN